MPDVGLIFRLTPTHIANAWLKIIAIYLLLNYSGPAEEECDIANVRELNISETLVPSWKMCCSITEKLNRLTKLNVSGNRWPIPPHDAGINEPKECLESMLQRSMSNMEELVVGEMGYNWNDVRIVANSLPLLRYILFGTYCHDL